MREIEFPIAIYHDQHGQYIEMQAPIDHRTEEEKVIDTFIVWLAGEALKSPLKNKEFVRPNFSRRKPFHYSFLERIYRKAKAWLGCGPKPTSDGFTPGLLAQAQQIMAVFGKRKLEKNTIIFIKKRNC